MGEPLSTKSSKLAQEEAKYDLYSCLIPKDYTLEKYEMVTYLLY